MEQFFDYQVTPNSQKVPLASFHLKGEASEWWPWLKHAYKEEDKEGSRIHPKFYVSLLKKKLGEFTSVNNELPPFNDGGDIVMEIETILDTHRVKKGSKIIEECLIKWKHMQDDDAAWINAYGLHEKFVQLNLGDKVPVMGVVC